MTSQMAIICVDDEPALLRTLKIELKQLLKQCFVETAESGEEALDLLAELLEENYEIPLVISDYIMPNMKGDELLKRVHRLSPGTLNIMLTGQATIEAVGNAVNSASLYRYIAKPVDRLDLKLTVQEAIQSYLQSKELKQFYADLEQKIAERTTELHQVNAQLRHNQMQLEHQNAKLTQLNQEKNEFLGIVVHDLKNPLANVLGLLQTVEEEAKAMSLQGYMLKNLAVIRNSAQLMLQLTTNLLDVNQIESGEIKLHLQSINIRSVLERLVRVYTRRAAQKNINLHYHAEPFKCLIHVDERALYQILDNLLSNAVKYTPFDKDIQVNVYAKTDQVCCEICDQGAGLSVQDQEKLFRKFSRLSTKPTGGEHSTGLGLYIVKKLVEAMSGDIFCESQVGHGSKFTVVFAHDQSPQ